jgi:hypothetical protein
MARIAHEWRTIDKAVKACAGIQNGGREDLPRRVEYATNLAAAALAICNPDALGRECQRLVDEVTKLKGPTVFIKLTDLKSGGTFMGAQARRVEHLWSCEQCRNQFRLVETSDDRYETHFD